MKRLVILLFGFFFSLYSFSQNFAEVGAAWHYTKQFFFNPPWVNSFTVIESTRDTLLNGKKCSQLTTKNGGYMYSYTRPEIFVYQENRIVYFWVEKLKRFETLYNFTTKQDSIWETKFYDQGSESESSIYVRVDSISNKNMNARMLKTLHVTYCEDSLFRSFSYKYKSTIVETLGDLNYLFNWWEENVDGDYITGLRCYRDSTFGVYTSWIAPSCDYISVSLNEHEHHFKLEIYPNPTNAYLNMESPFSVSYQIIEISGRVVQESFLGMGRNQIDVWELKSGIYFLRIEQNGKIMSTRFIKE